jgi:hypothetical protein
MVYLSLGRPVLLQDTGWPAAVEPQLGFWAFQDVAGAAEKIREVESNMEANSVGAAGLARTVFAPRNTLAPLLERLG